jgi:hypothetical protein
VIVSRRRGLPPKGDRNVVQVPKPTVRKRCEKEGHYCFSNSSLFATNVISFKC